MVYLDFERSKIKYLEAQRMYDQVLSDKEGLFSMTQPKGTAYDGDVVIGGHPQNTFDMYLIKQEFEQIDIKIMEIKSLIDERKHLMDIQEERLRKSKALVDRIYLMKYLECRRVSEIAWKVSYSESQVYRILDRIQQTCKEMRKML